jgi:hypothetical protein
MDGNRYILVVYLYIMNNHSEVQEQKIVEIDDPELRVKKEHFRECPVCLERGNNYTLYDPCMLSRHLRGPKHSKEDIVEFLLDEIQEQDIFDYLR